VLCSDGVTALVSEREIGQIVKNAEHRDAAAEAILDAVDARGGSDNASIIVCEFTCPEG
jgi:serine/threonine protein phosphatase PrpC